MTEPLCAPKLHLNSNIPVVEIEGEWNETTSRSVSEVVAHLVQAGHYEIIVNLSRMTRSAGLDRTWLETLERTGASIRSHFGRLDIVGTVDQVQQAVRAQRAPGLLWATSEEEAIGRIKGLPVYRSGPILTMRLAR